MNKVSKKRQKKTKKRRTLFKIALLLSVSLFFLLFTMGPEQIEPYPYKPPRVSPPPWAQTPQILIIGDKRGTWLSPYIKSLQEQTSKGLAKPLTIYNWSSEGEILALTLQKIKSLKKIPRLVIYHGGAGEFTQLRYPINYQEKLETNIRLWEKPSFSSTIMLFPPLSRFLYQYIPRLSLDKSLRPKLESDGQKMKFIELTTKLYQLELRELKNAVLAKGSQILLITGPVNLDVQPEEVCRNAQTQSILEVQANIATLMKKNKNKQAYNLAQKLVEKSLGNAMSHYLLGKSALSIGQFKAAQRALTKAKAFDCSLSNSQVLMNGVMKSLATRTQIPLIDFAHLINRHLGRNVLFLSQELPQNLYYQQLTSHIAAFTRQVFDL